MSRKSYIYIFNWETTQKALKIGKADDIYNRYLQLKPHYGDADLPNSFWIEVPASKATYIEAIIHLRLNKFRKEIPIKADGSTEFFDKTSLASLRELCNDMDLIIQKGVYVPNKKIKRKIDPVSQEQRRQEEFKKILRKNQRVLSRLIKVLKYLNSEQNDFVLKYRAPIKIGTPFDSQRISTPEKQLVSTVICSNKKLKSSFLDWLTNKSRIKIFSNKRDFRVSALIKLYFKFEYEYITEFTFDDTILEPLKSIQNDFQSKNPDSYNYMFKYLDSYFKELITLIEEFFKKIEKFEWNEEANIKKKFGIFEFLKSSQREIKLKLELEKIECILEYEQYWELKSKNNNTSIVIDKTFINNITSSKDKRLYFSNKDNYYKFLKFVNDLFIKDIIQKNGKDTKIYYPESISDKIYSLDNLDLF